MRQLNRWISAGSAIICPTHKLENGRSG